MVIDDYDDPQLRMKARTIVQKTRLPSSGVHPEVKKAFALGTYLTARERYGSSLGTTTGNGIHGWTRSCCTPRTWVVTETAQEGAAG